MIHNRFAGWSIQESSDTDFFLCQSNNLTSYYMKMSMASPFDYQDQALLYNLNLYVAMHIKKTGIESIDFT